MTVKCEGYITEKSACAEDEPIIASYVWEGQEIYFCAYHNPSKEEIEYRGLTPISSLTKRERMSK